MAKEYVLISKGLSIGRLDRYERLKFALDKKIFKTKLEAEKFLNKKSYKIQKNHKIAMLPKSKLFQRQWAAYNKYGFRSRY